MNKLVDISKNKPLSYTNGKLNNFTKRTIIYQPINHSISFEHKKHYFNTITRQKRTFSSRYWKYSNILNKDRFTIYSEEREGGILTKNEIIDNNENTDNIKSNVSKSEEKNDLNITEYIDKELDKKLEDEMNNESQMSFDNVIENEETSSTSSMEEENALEEVNDSDNVNDSADEDKLGEVNIPFKLGDIVLGEVTRKVKAGATVRLIDYPGYTA